jgi:hypothetical protein
MKRETTRHRTITSKKQIKEDWIEYWKNISQERIQAWIKKIPEYIQEIIRLDGGNKYKESKTGRKRNPDRIY